MKIDIQIELDWIEDGNVDEEVKHQIIGGIVSELKKEIVGDLKSTAMRQASEKVNEWIMEELKKFTDRRITITDKWGDATEHHESLSEMFKTKFDNFFNASVDKDGKDIVGCTYGNRTTRVQFILNKMADEYMKGLTEKMRYDIERSVDQARKKAIADQITEHVKKVAGLK